MSNKKLLWLDLEMSGLDPNIHHIVEIAAIITDMDFRPIDQYHEVIFQTQEVLDQMDPWCIKTHGASGLTKLIPAGKKLDLAEQELLDVINQHFRGDDRPILAGNSVGNDRVFIDRYMPELSKRLHYRIVDVSSFKEIFRSKYGVEYQKKNAHRAVDDIHESIEELKHYLSMVTPPNSSKR
jgi:oligoribonuclease